LQIENLDHLGIVASLVDELGLVEVTDGVLGTHKLNNVSSGQVVKARGIGARPEAQAQQYAHLALDSPEIPGYSPGHSRASAAGQQSL